MTTPSARMASVVWGAIWLVIVLVTAVAIARGGLIAAVGLAGLPIAALVLILLVQRPLLGLHFILAASFSVAGLNRYLKIPAGLSIDFLMALLVAIIFVREMTVRDWSRVQNSTSLLVLVWIGYNILELLNPEPISVMAWFYAGRGVAFYMMLVLLGMHLIRTRQQVMGFVVHWGIWATIMAIWGIKQSHLGVTDVEARWLAAGAHRTHILFGKLRAFSFLSDAGQFGVTMAYTATFFGLLCFAPLTRWQRAASGVVAATCFYGMMCSGTRSAVIAIPVGGLAFALICRNFKIAVPTVSVIGAFVGILKFTTLGQGTYAIQRMRQAVNPMEDPSFLVRLENQKRLMPYLQDHWMGGGVGSAGYWGQRFTPGTFLAELALDSYYVKLAAEQGPIGFFYFMLMIGFVAYTGFRNYPRVQDPTFRVVIGGLWAVLLGVLVASYSNQYFGQIPTGVVVYIAMAVMTLAPRIDRETPDPD